MLNSLPQLFLRAGQFVWRKPREALLLARMAGWVLLLTTLIRLLPLPRVLRVVATAPRQAQAETQACSAERLAQLIDLLLELIFLRNQFPLAGIIGHGSCRRQPDHGKCRGSKAFAIFR